MTDAQVPSWLDTSNPRIKIVDHMDIFEDPTDLPVFNSNAIETQIYRIPGLSRHFLYLNDDFLLINDVTVSDFFDFHDNSYSVFNDNYFYTNGERCHKSDAGSVDDC